MTVSLGRSGPCDFCFFRKLQCSLVNNRINLPSNLPNSVEARPSIHQTIGQLGSGRLRDLHVLSLLPPPDVCKDLINVYFDTLDQAVGSLFHRQSFLEAYERQEVPVVLLLCIFALAAR